MSRQAEDLKSRTKAFAVAVVRFCDTLPHTVAAQRIGRQLIDCGTSVAANYRAACRAATRPMFISKIATVLEEADESEFWLEMLVETSLASEAATGRLRQEANELTAIFAASLRTAKSHR